MTALQIPTSRIWIPMLAPSRYKAAYGGRGGGKSHFFAELLIERCLQIPTTRAVCVREIQRSLGQSVKRLLEDKIVDLNVGYHFEVQKGLIRVRGSDSGLIIFNGMQEHTAESIKSLEGFDIAWVEEAQAFSRHSLNLLRPTIRKQDSELWFSWNPRQASDPVDEFFRKDEPPPGSVIVNINHDSNPHLPQTLKDEIEYDYRIDPTAADHVWKGGYWARTDAQIFDGKWIIEDFEPREDWDGPYHGVDWGFSVDPTTLVRVWIHEETLYIEAEAYGVKVDLGLPTSQLFERVHLARGHILRADNARPESVSLMSKGGEGWDGWNIVSAPKWKGSVEDGIEFIRKFKQIVIHSRCGYAGREARLYSYKVDRLTGDVMPAIEDKHNHIWDAVRYALSPLIRQRTWRGL